MNIWTELSTPEGKRVGYDEMVGNTSRLNAPADDENPIDTPKTRLDVALQFWFNRNPGLALPLIALQYHEVKLNLDLETGAKLARDDTEVFTLNSCKLYVDYVYLDTDERRRFAQVSHEYLIEQVQFTGDESILEGTTKRVDLSFNHPVKELIWVAQSTAQARSGTNGNEPCQFNRCGMLVKYQLLNFN
jgi:hypothetical protein